MKRTLLVATCALLVSALFSSCQKEDKSIIELTQELTSELQQITDLPSANARAARVSVLNKRFQDASVRVLALNSTSLQRGADGDDGHQGASYASALKALAREVGRVRASYPSTSHDGEVDRDKLLMAIGAANGESDPEKCKEVGLSFVQDDTGTHETPGNFPEYYGSEKLRAALSYRADVGSVSNLKFDDAADVPAVPAVSAAVAEDTDGGADQGGDDDDSAPAADDDDSSAADDDDAPASDDEDDDEL